MDRNEIRECECISKSLHLTKPITFKYALSFNPEAGAVIQETSSQTLRAVSSNGHWLPADAHTRACVIFLGWSGIFPLPDFSRHSSVCFAVTILSIYVYILSTGPWAKSFTHEISFKLFNKSVTWRVCPLKDKETEAQRITAIVIIVKFSKTYMY